MRKTAPCLALLALLPLVAWGPALAIKTVRGFTDVEVVARWSHYRRQHVRWARDLFATASHQYGAAGAMPLRRRVELALLSAGYLDRIAFLVAIVLVIAGALAALVPILYLAVAAAGVVVAVGKAGAARRLPAIAIAVSAVFVLDVVTTVVAALAHLLRVPRVARSPERQAPAAAD